MANVVTDSKSTWFASMVEDIEKAVRDKLIESCTGIYNSLFTNMNNKMNEAGGIISQSPSQWSGGTVDLIQNLSETVIFPIAGIIITYVFCYELIQLVSDSNSMKIITPKELIMVLLKAFVALLVLSNSFRIVMAFFELGNYATRKMSRVPDVDVGNTVDISDMLASESIPGLIGAVILLGIAWLITYILAIAIYVAINAWFLEIFIYSSAASIPFATFLNKEWGQMGYNYTRKIMALAFQSFFMLLCLMIYSSRLSDVASGDLTQKLIEIVGGGAVLVFTLFKCGNISASVFNAH